jgi:lambda family phage minor tail protein L
VSVFRRYWHPYYAPPSPPLPGLALSGAAQVDVTEGADTVAATASQETHGTVDITEAGDTGAAAGGGNNIGVLNVTEAGDTAAGIGFALNAADAIVTEAPDTVTAAGSSVVGSQGGVLNITEAPDTAAGLASRLTHGAVNRTEAPDVVLAEGGSDAALAFAKRRPSRSLAADIQSLTPGGVWEGFTIDGRAFGAGIWRFSNWLNELGESVVWQGETFAPWPVTSEGWEISTSGALPRPTVTLANIAGFLSGLCIDFADMGRAKVTRHRTFVRHLDGVNFAGGNAQANAARHFADEVYIIDRKVAETYEAVTWELTSVFDLAGVMLPRGIILSDTCQWQYRGGFCAYSGAAMFDEFDQRTTNPAQDDCSKTLHGCVLRFGLGGVRTRAFPAAQIVGA